MNDYITTMVILLLGVAGLDYLLKTRLLPNKRFWLLQILMAVMTLVYDLISADIFWYFNSQATIGLDILKTPVENLIFGMSLVGYTVVLYEYSQNKSSKL